MVLVGACGQLAVHTATPTSRRPLSTHQHLITANHRSTAPLNFQKQQLYLDLGRFDQTQRLIGRAAQLLLPPGAPLPLDLAAKVPSVVLSCCACCRCCACRCCAALWLCFASRASS